MKPLDYLTRKARQSAQQRGHRLRYAVRNGETARMECRFCGMHTVVTLPGRSINGPALDYLCERTAS